MKVVVRTSTYPLHLDGPPRFITFPVSRTHLLIQIQPHHTAQVPESHTADLYIGHLTFSSSEEDDDTPADEISSSDSVTPVQYHLDAFQQTSSKYTLNAYITLEEEEEEENFPTVPLNDEHWDMEEITDRHLCIHEQSLPHGLCPYPCPYLDYQASSYYDTLDLSDISEFEDLMTTSSNEDIPALNDIGY